MAKKARKKSKLAKKTKTRAKKKAAKRVSKRKARRASKPKTIGDRLSSGYHIMVDTVKGTEKLRAKMEKPGTDETE